MHAGAKERRGQAPHGMAQLQCIVQWGVQVPSRELHSLWGLPSVAVVSEAAPPEDGARQLWLGSAARAVQCEREIAESGLLLPEHETHVQGNV